MTESPAETDAAPAAHPGPPPAPPLGAPTGGDRFFAWLRGLGLIRADGWIGGVCAGIAERIGIDPVIVRGIFVVAALFSLPMFLVYAIGWALLPDTAGRIHAQELLRRRFDPAMVGIGLLLLLSVFPVTQSFFGVVLPFGYIVPGYSQLSPLAVLANVAVVAVILVLIFLAVRSSRRAAPTGGVPASHPRTASADPGAALAVDRSGVDAHAGPAEDAGASMAGSAPLPPAPAAPDASPDDLAQWRIQHDAWRAQDDAWRRQQKDAEAAAREQARAERSAAAAAFAAEAAERRRLRRLTNPRTSVAFVALVIGAALVVGASTALIVGATEDANVAVAGGLLSGTVVLGLGMVVAGIRRRRSGFLAFLTTALLVAGAATAVPAATQGLAFGYTYVSNADPRSFTQVWGDLSVDVWGSGGGAPIDIVKRNGSTRVVVGVDSLADLDVSGVDVITWTSFDVETGEFIEDGTWTASAGSGREPRIVRSIDTTDADTPRPEAQVIRLEQPGGHVHVEIYENAPEER
ncbi:PspC domain-containing protein [Microbacterium sp. SLBN-146]|uniref:PspC domain-containing protein n=1 Tax=Microbacterium sp. SLBN-146 TaxID=2768457 RepID=UPI00114F751C|nr:PspC domain-containing protein [Microbacterium sp. SLBN-146]TQJ29620.1 phage shock protein C (PspC) family protein [Microbacterium sp. SLBN-146]